MSDYRIVVTGSRHWVDGEEANIIRNKLALAFDMATELGNPFMEPLCVTEAEVVFVHGGARGADAIADAWIRKRGHRVEVFPADWAKHGKAAGPIRNAAMLDAGATIVLAFPFGCRATSPGTWNCVEMAARRGLPVAVFPRAILEGTAPA